jgi:glycerophosphoryl diester phosphodiesterase
VSGMRPFLPRPAEGSHAYVIAHRGLSARAPENTMAAFQRAAQTPGIDMVELDVRLSRDEEVIILHDRALQRTTTGNGPARSYTLAEIQSFDAGSWFHPSFRSESVPTLKTLLNAVRNRLWVNIEIKSDWFHRESLGFLERRVLDIVTEAGMLDRVFFSSFDHTLIGRLKDLCPAAWTGVIYNLHWNFFSSPSHLQRKTKASVFVCGRHEFRRSFVVDAHRVGMAVYVYTVDAAEEIGALIAMGVDGIISNAADEVVPIVQRVPR